MYNYNPPSPNSYNDAYQQAERRVKAKVGFYWHLASYVLVNGILVAIYLLSSLAAGEFYYFWPLWPMACWGIGLIFHYLAVYVFPDTPADRERMIADELRRMNVFSPADSTRMPSRPEDFTPPVDHQQ